jgi:hypothetical protein
MLVRYLRVSSAALLVELLRWYGGMPHVVVCPATRSDGFRATPSHLASPRCITRSLPHVAHEPLFRLDMPRMCIACPCPSNMPRTFVVCPCSVLYWYARSPDKAWLHPPHLSGSYASLPQSRRIAATDPAQQPLCPSAWRVCSTCIALRDSNSWSALLLKITRAPAICHAASIRSRASTSSCPPSRPTKLLSLQDYAESEATSGSADHPFCVLFNKPRTTVVGLCPRLLLCHRTTESSVPAAVRAAPD